MNGAVEIIKQSINMYDVLGRYGFELNRKGFIRCPFHSEKTASLKLYKNGERFHCFGCGKDGSVIDFVKDFNNLDFSAAIVRIGYEFGIPLPDTRQLSMRERENLRRGQFLRKEQQEIKKRQKIENKRKYDVLVKTYKFYKNLSEELKPKFDGDFRDDWKNAVLQVIKLESELERFEFVR